MLDADFCATIQHRWRHLFRLQIIAKQREIKCHQVVITSDWQTNLNGVNDGGWLASRKAGRQAGTTEYSRLSVVQLHIVLEHRSEWCTQTECEKDWNSFRRIKNEKFNDYYDPHCLLENKVSKSGLQCSLRGKLYTLWACQDKLNYPALLVHLVIIILFR